MTSIKEIEKYSSGLHKDVFVNGKAALTFDDVWMVPQFSDIASRDDVDLSYEIFDGFKVENPLVATCMDTVCGSEMLIEMALCGGTGMLHRGCSPKEQGNMLYDVGNTLWSIDHKHKYPYVVGYAVSCGSWKDRIIEFQNVVNQFPSNNYFICLDVAHAHTSMYKETLKNLYDYCQAYFDKPIKILAGTIATPQAAEYLYEYCDGIRVGVGSGSACSTRINTGHGVPLFQSLIETAEVCHDLGIKCFADGGLRTAGDMVKALAVGADALDLGGVLAPTSKSPAEKIYDYERTPEYPILCERLKQISPHPQDAIRRMAILEENKKIVAVRYRGMASADAQKDYSEKTRKSGYYVEGESFEMPYMGETSDIVDGFLKGIRSGLSYTGAHNIQELRDKARFRTSTFAGLAEAKPHGKR